MRDIREQILSRVLDINTTIAPPNRSFRNRSEITGRVGVGIILNDGDEAQRQDAIGTKNVRGRIGAQILFMEMTPSVQVLIPASSENLGASSNSYRARLLAAYFGDTELQTIVGPNGQMEYLGCTFEDEAGENQQGRLTLNLSITYPFRIADLLA